MGSRYGIILDIDDTLLSTELRKARAYREATGRELPDYLRYGVIELDPRAFRSAEEKNRFFQRFLSPELLELDEPLEGAAEVVRELFPAHVLVYLSGRPDQLALATQDQLRQHGYPVDGVRILLREEPVEAFADTGYNGFSSFKAGAVQEVRKELRFVVSAWIGIGNEPDVKPYTEAGLAEAPNRIVVIEKYPVEVEGITVIGDWNDIRRELASLFPS